MTERFLGIDLGPSVETSAVAPENEIQNRENRRVHTGEHILRRGLSLLAVAGALAAGMGIVSADAETAEASVNTTTMTFNGGHPGKQVPERFDGLSFEMHSLHLLGTYYRKGNFGNILKLIGPGAIRFSGNSVESTKWQEKGSARGMPWSTTSVTALDYRRMEQLVRPADWNVELGIGLKHYNRQAAASESRAAKNIFGRSLMDLQFGNEPDRYGQASQRSYISSVRGYETAVRRAAGSYSLGGTDITDIANLGSWKTSVRDIRPSIVTTHFYPMHCGDTRTMGRLLSPQTRQREGAAIARYMNLADSIHRPLRIDETNSASCEGKSGVSDRYGAALWGADYIVRAMAAGVSGLNFHNQPENCQTYSLVCAPSRADLMRGALRAQPMLYSLLLTKSLIGSRPITSRQTPQINDLETQAFITPQGELKISAVNFGDTSAVIQVNAPQKTGSVISLRGRSLRDKSHITLGGAKIDRRGEWHPSDISPVSNDHGEASVVVPPLSAEVIELR